MKYNPISCNYLPPVKCDDLGTMLIVLIPSHINYRNNYFFRLSLTYLFILVLVNYVEHVYYLLLIDLESNADLS